MHANACRCPIGTRSERGYSRWTGTQGFITLPSGKAAPLYVALYTVISRSGNLIDQRPCQRIEFTDREILWFNWSCRTLIYRWGYMRLTSAKEFAALILKARNAQKMTQPELAAASGTGVRFIVDLEKGKPSCQLEKSLIVARMLGIEIFGEVKE